MKKRNIILIIVAIVLVGTIATGVYFYQSSNKPNDTTQTATKASKVTYKGKSGVTALALLKQNAKVVASKEGFIESINGYTPSSSRKETWSFYVNDKLSMEGAGTYITKDSETITWKIDTY